MNVTPAPALEDRPVDIKLRLAALWTAATLCYAYADILGLYQSGNLARIMEGSMGPLGPVTQGVLASVAAFMAVPAAMVALSIVLRARANRWLNLVAGTLYTLVILLTIAMASWFYYYIFGAVEVLLTGTVVWLAARWPRSVPAGASG